MVALPCGCHRNDVSVILTAMTPDVRRQADVTMMPTDEAASSHSFPSTFLTRNCPRSSPKRAGWVGKRKKNPWATRKKTP